MKLFYTASLLLLVVASANAVPVILNNVATPFAGVATVGAPSFASTLVAPTALSLTGQNGGLFGGTTEAVYTDTGAGPQGCAGCLDFVYQFHITGDSLPNGVVTATLMGYNYGQIAFDWAAYFAAGTEPAGFVSPTSANPTPTTADQTFDKQAIHFNWVGVSGGPVNYGLGVGDSSVLVVYTSAVSLNMNTLELQDGGQLFFDAYTPAPEPAYAGLLLGGLFGLGLLVARRFQAKQN